MHSRTETLTDVPPELVDRIIAGFTSDGAVSIIQPDGRFTVVAVFDVGDRATYKTSKRR